MANVILYGTRHCGYCRRARGLLNELGVEYEDIPVDGNPELRKTMEELTGGYTVPQILINDKPIGGCDDLFALHQSGDLQALLSN